MSPATRSAPEDAPIEASPPPRARLGSWALAGRWGGAVLGAVLLVAAYAKLLDPGALVEQVRAEGLEILLPAPALAVLALLLEIGLGLLLLLGVRSRGVLWSATALVAFFLFLTGRAYLRALSGAVDEGHGCGCFGNLIERTPAEAFWWDAALLLPTLALAWVAPPPDWAPTPWRRIAVASLLTAGLLVFAGLAPDLPLDDVATRLKPGLTVTEVCAGRDEKRACLLDAIPLLGEGRHFVVLADVDAPAFAARIEEFNEHALSGREPLLWVLSSASAEHLQAYQLRTGATFPLQTSPKSLLRPLYRRLPRAFLVQDGRILQTWSEIPPLSQLPSPQGG